MLDTNRLKIRPWEKSDLQFLYDMANDIGYNNFSTPGTFAIRDEAEAENKIALRINLFEEHKIGKLLVFEKDRGTFVGTCGGDFFELDGHREIELGYRLMLNAWGKGYATEAAVAMTHYLKKITYDRFLYGFALKENHQSIKILQKCGMTFDRVFDWKGLPHQLYKI